MNPQTIGRYRIKAELGRGGMSTVYLAHDPHFDRDVAVKLLPLELLHQPTFRLRFEREAKIVAALDHPAIVPVYDFGEEKGQPFLVMRFMAGGSLSDRLKQGSLSIKETAVIMSRLAPALDEVHAHGIIHRDLKPSNVLFDQQMQPYISDFGTAKLLHAHTQLTDTGSAVGTPAYMSPEQIHGDIELDGRSDIYSLGVILFEMLSGNHPFQTDTPIAVAVKHIFEPVPFILDVVPDLPIQCQEIITRAMAKEKSDRFLNAELFASALENIVNTIETSTLRALAQGQDKIVAKRYALLIHNDEFHDFTLGKLVRPAANISHLATVLRDTAIGNFDEVAILYNESAQAIRRGISTFFANKNPEDMLLLYYTGHAAIGTRNRLYLAASNTEHNLLRGTAIPAGFVADEMDNSASKQQILILDCHFSNAIDTNLPSLVGQTVNAGAIFAHNGHDRVVITATDSTQYNWYNNEVKGKATPSQFTRHLVQGLESGAADIDNDGQINVHELYAYVYDCVARNSIDEQIQMPRKWTPYASNEESSLIIANVSPRFNNHHASFQKPSSPFIARISNLPQHYLRWLMLGVLVLTIGLLFATQRSRAFNDMNSIATTTITAAASPTKGSVASLLEEPTSLPTEPVIQSTPTTVATKTVIAELIPTATISPTVTTTASPTEIAITTIALLSSSLFEKPDSNTGELTFVGAGDQVEILGRAEFGSWLYVRDGKGVEGFVYGPRFDWEGEYESLSIVHITVTASSESVDNSSCNDTACPTLIADIYPLASFCVGDIKYREVFMQGRGGNNVYTYYWDNERIAGPIESGFSFEVSSVDGTAVIGTVKIVSGDGQILEKKLFVSEFSCNE